MFFVYLTLFKTKNGYANELLHVMIVSLTWKNNQNFQSNHLGDGWKLHSLSLKATGLYNMPTADLLKLLYTITEVVIEAIAVISTLKIGSN